MKKDATLKQIAAVKPIVSNGNHVEKSNIWAFLRGSAHFNNVKMRNSFPLAKVKSGTSAAKDGRRAAVHRLKSLPGTASGPASSVV